VPEESDGTGWRLADMKTESFLFTSKRELTDILTMLSRMNIDAGKNYELRIGPAGDIKSVQRVLYFRWLGDLVSHTGHSKDELHEIFKEKFLRDIYYRDEADFRAATDSGKNPEVSITRASEEQMREYMDCVYHEAANMDFILQRGA